VDYQEFVNFVKLYDAKNALRAGQEEKKESKEEKKH
jgi:hypothetical protein